MQVSQHARSKSRLKSLRIEGRSNALMNTVPGAMFWSSSGKWRKLTLSLAYSVCSLTICRGRAGDLEALQELGL